MGYFFKAATLLAYFAFFQNFKSGPHTTSSFDPLKQLAQADIFFAHPGAHILKWSKTIQMNNSVQFIRHSFPRCIPVMPYYSLEAIACQHPQLPTQSLFQIRCYQSGFPLQIQDLGKTFSTILKKLNLTQSNITFHSLRRSGATLAFNSSVPKGYSTHPESWHLDVEVRLVIYYPRPPSF